MKTSIRRKAMLLLKPLWIPPYIFFGHQSHSFVRALCFGTPMEHSLHQSSLMWQLAICFTCFFNGAEYLQVARPKLASLDLLLSPEKEEAAGSPRGSWWSRSSSACPGRDPGDPFHCHAMLQLLVYLTTRQVINQVNWSVYLEEGI